MSRPLDVLLRSLQLAGLDLDAEAALDSLWLGREMRAREPARDALRGSTSANVVAPADIKGTTPAVGDGEPRASSGTKKRRDSLSMRTADFATPVAASRPDVTAPARTVTLSRAAALPASRELIKALRPLRRRVISPGAGVLDVDATVRRAAEEDLWFPSFASARERWLDVLLVADHGMSMILWKDTVDEFERLLRNSGAFRSVRSWWLESDADTPAIAARGRGPVPATPERLARMTRGAGRSVVLVVSDCVGVRWHDGSIPRLVGAWSRVLPVALMQVTPEWFWARTALGDTVGSRFRSAVPAAVNHQFRWDPSALGVFGLSTQEEKTFLRVPAATLTSDAVARLAGLIAGVGREWAPGVIFDLTWEQEEDEPVPGPPATAQERVARFRALASKAAQRLAAGFAASPVRTLGVLRLLRRDLLPDAGAFVEAEVMLGGIVRVKREEARWDAGASLPLEFVPGVQSLLLDGAVAGDVLRVLTHAAAVAQTGVGPTFTSWLENPSSGTAQLDPAESAFASAAAQVLERLGGAYAKMVKPAPEAVEPQQAAQYTIPQAEQTDEFPDAVGTPHQLPCPQVLHGRREQLFQVNRWVGEQFAPQVMTLVGTEGIGKSALAGQTVFNWRQHWPDDEPFVWCFQRDPTSGEAFRLLRKYAGVPASADAHELTDALSRRPRTLVVFDGIDGITDSRELSTVLGAASSIASNANARVLVTSRESLSERLRAEQISLEPLDRAAVEALVFELVPTLGIAPLLDQQEHLLAGMVQDLGGGNPLVIKTLVEQLTVLTVEGLIEELVPDEGERRAIHPHELPEIQERIELAGRARELSAKARSLAARRNKMKDAYNIFSEVVDLRSRLPSKRLRARALFDRGSVSLARKKYDRASSDLADAVGIFRTLSAHRELIPALEALAEAREKTGGIEEAMSLLNEALEHTRAIGDSADTDRVLARLATLRGSAAAPPSEVLQGDDRVLTAEFLVSGRVAGVGFRVFVQRCAAEIGIEGEAQNLPDGRVRVRATGPRSRLQELEQRLRRGPPGAVVEHVETTILVEAASSHQTAETNDVAQSSNAAPRRTRESLERAVIAIGIGRPSDDTLPTLDAARHAAHQVAEWATSSQRISKDRVILLTDETSVVSSSRILDAVASIVALGSIDQLIVYFAGYAINVRNAEYWLLSQSRDNPNALVDVEGSKLLARSAGIPHVIFISDTCRVSPYSISAQAAVGQMMMFPSMSTRGTAVAIDRFSASRVSHSSEDVKDVGDAARRYAAAFTMSLLSVLGGDQPSTLDQRDGVRFVRPRALATYLTTAGYRRALGSLDAEQEPEVHIESSDDAWLARFERF